MDSFQLLAFLVDAVTAVHGTRAIVVFGSLPGGAAYAVNILVSTDTVVSVDHADMRVALRDAVIAFDVQLRSDACPALDGFGLVALAQRKRREADAFADRGSDFVAADLRRDAEQLEAEALGIAHANAGAS